MTQNDEKRRKTLEQRWVAIGTFLETFAREVGFGSATLHLEVGRPHATVQWSTKIDDQQYGRSIVLDWNILQSIRSVEKFAKSWAERVRLEVRHVEKETNTLCRPNPSST